MLRIIADLSTDILAFAIMAVLVFLLVAVYSPETITSIACDVTTTTSLDSAHCQSLARL